MDTLPADASEKTPQPRPRRAPKSLDERIDALTKQAVALRQKRSEQQRKNADRLVHLLGNTLVAMMEQNADLRATLTTQMLAKITRPADRELLHMWLASFPE